MFADIVINGDWSESEVIGQLQEGSGGLILCYAQVLSVVEVGSLLVMDIA